MNVLIVDIGGTHVKFKTSRRREPVVIDSGPKMTPSLMMRAILNASSNWSFDHVSIGYPGVVIHNRPIVEPYNLAPGWVGFDFHSAFGKPLRMLNDAAMQALGSYQGGRMLFLGLGTGLGSAMVVDGFIEAMELAHLPCKGNRTYEYFLGEAGLKRFGTKKWSKHVLEAAEALQKALLAEYVILGGGNARILRHLPATVRLGSNSNAFKGGQAMWHSLRS